MFTKLFDRIVTPIVTALAAAILKSDAAKEFLAQAIADRVNVKAVGKNLDYGALYDELDTSDLYTHIAKHCDVSASDIAGHLDAEDIAQHVEIDYYDLASHYESSEIASHIDMSDLARECEVDASEVTVDYEALAKALLKELAKPKVEVKSSK